jgi:HK97 family phage major capsid protein
MSPKTVAAYTDISRRMLLQSSIDVEMFVRSDLASVLALAIDSAAIAGTGASGQPTGILNTSGIGLVALGTDGAAPTWASQIALETAVATSNADIGNLKYITNAKGRGKLKGTEIATGTAQFLWGRDGMINGYEALATNQIPANLTKGSGTNLSAELFGNFSDLIIGLWGSLDINVDPYSLGTSGAVRVTAFQDCDIGIRHAASFAAIKDMVTA